MEKTGEQLLSEYARLLVEARIREVEVSDGSKVKHGSSKHIRDLRVRIADLSRWKNQQKKGSDARANYSRVIQRLKGELRSAERAAQKDKK